MTYRDGYRTDEDYVASRRLVWQAARAQLIVSVIGGLIAIAAWWVLA